MSILDGYRDFNRKKYIKSEKSAIVCGDVYEPRALASILPYLKGKIVKAGAGKGWMQAKPGLLWCNKRDHSKLSRASSSARLSSEICNFQFTVSSIREFMEVRKCNVSALFVFPCSAFISAYTLGKTLKALILSITI